MNHDLRELLGDAERAVRDGDVAHAIGLFIDAGDCAVRYQLWRAAVRCYRGALELDLIDATAVKRLVLLGGRVRCAPEWSEYARALDRGPDWPHFGCRGAQLVIEDRGAVVGCPPVGTVLEVMMTERDLVEVFPDARITGMPLGMALIVLHRALFPERPVSPMRVRVAFAGREQVWLDELGDWELA